MIPVLIALFLLSSKTEAQNPDDQTNFNPEDAVTSFQPSLAVVIGILSILFFITFILLIYAKFCHHNRLSGRGGRGDPENPVIAARARLAQFSGINKAVIESLPFFRFSSLKGLRQGLECAVCLSRFEDVEILRLLPKCKHAFHIDCIDRWLEKHSSCPLCRRKVSAEDPALFACSSSMRVIDSGTGAGDGPSFEVFVKREESLRFGGFGSSFHRIFRGNNNDGNLNNCRNNGDKWQTEEIQEEERFQFHRFKHKIVVSGVMIKHRWSNLTSSDLRFLSKEMTNSSPGIQFSNLQPRAENVETAANLWSDDNDVMTKIKEEMERKRTFESRLSAVNKAALVPSTSRTVEGNAYGQTSKTTLPVDRRVMSEIMAVSRFAEKAGDDGRDERMKKIWLPIASRTIHWFASRERNPQDDGDDHHHRITN